MPRPRVLPSPVPFRRQVPQFEHRTSNFIDPKGRALTTGVQYAQGLVALGGDDEQLEKDNNKRYIDGVGTMSLSITKVDPETGEFAGVFSAIQPSDSDMGGREVVDIKISGELYGRLETSTAAASLNPIGGLRALFLCSIPSSGRISPQRSPRHDRQRYSVHAGLRRDRSVRRHSCGSDGVSIGTRGGQIERHHDP